MSQQRPGDATAAWAEAQVTALAPEGDIPEYGTAEWLALEPAAPRRAAAVITAAEQWRRHVHLLNDPAEWLRQSTRAADDHARRVIRVLDLARRSSYAELAEKLKPRPARPVTATPGWPPVAIPGRPGWWRHCIDGRQVDLPHREHEHEKRAA
ncbi:hypothetical protein ACG5V6_14990 [Streptomyces chitinivorans]|uniref:DUF2742 domain-containing protein n=1 Tax=Streptomyces chitinivorans TaxID=1257027 RepID=A0ABW7HUF2_9ACTN|nr:hypothetical protein [Streptomyces chitinivorans]MDH2407178.1 hypothetical protein [Streptomyces chitinivorans]